MIMIRKSDIAVAAGAFLLLLVAGAVLLTVMHWFGLAVLLALIAGLTIAVQFELYRRVQYLFNKPQQNYRQVEALFSLFSQIRPRAPLPPLRHFAISPDFANLLISLVREIRPRAIVELGSGTSTILNAYLLEAQGEGRVYALDHEEQYLRETGDQIQKHGLTDWVDLRHAPLQPPLDCRRPAAHASILVPVSGAAGIARQAEPGRCGAARRCGPGRRNRNRAPLARRASRVRFHQNRQ